jgi:hypothetical protein
VHARDVEAGEHRRATPHVVIVMDKRPGTDLVIAERLFVAPQSTVIMMPVVR